MTITNLGNGGVVTTAVLTTTSYTQTGLNASTTYSVTVVASNVAGTGALTTPANVTTQGQCRVREAAPAEVASNSFDRASMCAARAITQPQRWPTRPLASRLISSLPCP